MMLFSPISSLNLILSFPALETIPGYRHLLVFIQRLLGPEFHDS